jgi:hypothetical protein
LTGEEIGREFLTGGQIQCRVLIGGDVGSGDLTGGHSGQRLGVERNRPALILAAGRRLVSFVFAANHARTDFIFGRRGPFSFVSAARGPFLSSFFGCRALSGFVLVVVPEGAQRRPVRREGKVQELAPQI